MDVATKSRIENLTDHSVGAERLSDVNTLEALLTDGFLCVGPFGFVIDKQQYIRSRQSSDPKHELQDQWRIASLHLSAIAQQPGAPGR